jgi:hypothetical protein
MDGAFVVVKAIDINLGHGNLGLGVSIDYLA